RLIHPDDLKTMVHPARRYADLEDGEVHEFEYRIRHVDGTYRLLHNRDVVFSRAADGAPHVILGLAEDITDRKRAENSLRESEERLRLALNAGNCGTWDWDIINNRVFWSERLYDFHGVTPDTFGGTVEDFTALVHPDDLNRVRESIENAIQDSE